MSDLGYPHNDPTGTWTTWQTVSGEVFQAKQISPGGDVIAQAAFVAPAAPLTSAAPAAATSTPNTTPNGADAATTQTLANALKVSYNAAQADIAALVTELAAVQADVAALRTKLNAEMAALQGAGKPQAAS